MEIATLIIRVLTQYISKITLLTQFTYKAVSFRWIWSTIQLATISVGESWICNNDSFRLIFCRRSVTYNAGHTMHVKLKRREEKRREVQRMKCSLQTIHLLLNTPWVIENDNNAARAFCISAHRHMFLRDWHNCHSSSIFYLGNINLCCWSVRTVGGTEQSQASHSGLCGVLEL